MVTIFYNDGGDCSMRFLLTEEINKIMLVVHQAHGINKKTIDRNIEDEIRLALSTVQIEDRL